MKKLQLIQIKIKIF